jgi:hypothetical protein
MKIKHQKCQNCKGRVLIPKKIIFLYLMSNLVTFNDTILQSSVYGNYSDYVQEIIQAKKWISF